MRESELHAKQYTTQRRMQSSMRTGDFAKVDDKIWKTDMAYETNKINSSLLQGHHHCSMAVPSVFTHLGLFCESFMIVQDINSEPENVLANVPY